MVFPTKSGRLARLVRHRTSSSGGTNLEEHRHFARPLWKKTRSRLDRSWNKSERTYGQASFGSVSFHNRNKLEPLGVDVSWGQRKRHGFPVAFPAGETSQVAACLHAPDARTGVDSFSFGSPPNVCDQPRMPRGFGSRG